MAGNSERPSGHGPDDDDETRVQLRPKRLGFDSDAQDALPNEPTGPIDHDGATDDKPGPAPEASDARDDQHETRVLMRHDRAHPSYGADAERDAETRVGTMPDPAAREPAPMQDDEGATRVGPAPDLGGPKPQSDVETRVATAPDLGLTAKQPEPFDDAATRVGAIPDSATPTPPAPLDESDATRVSPSPQFMASQDSGKTQVAPPPSDVPRQERRNIASVDLPADLRLPTFDFKVSTSPEVVAARAAGAHTTLPEHLQLPTFPDLGKPPVAKSEVSVPPPVPKKAAPPPMPHVAEPTPPVIDLSLPDLAPRPTQRNLTLISGANQEGVTLAKRLLWPFVVAGVFAVIALGLFLAREQVVAVLAPKHAPPVAPPPTAQERAKSALAAGGLAYVAKDYQVAIQHFEEALKDDPRLVEAHRSLGIVYATMHDQAKAVRHYQDYLALSPHATDASEVLKIIEDYKHAQAKPQHEAAPPPPAEPSPKHRKGGRGQAGHHRRN